MILDEAHLLEDVATQYFGVQVSSHRVEDLCRDVERELKAARLDAPRRAARRWTRVRHRARAASSACSRGTTGRRLRPGLDDRRAWPRRRRRCCTRLEGLRTAILAMPERPEPLTGLAGRAQALARRSSRFVLAAEDDAHVYFVETRGRGVFLRATPIDVSAPLRELLFDRVRAAVLTSATLAVDGGFDYLKARLGLEATRRAAAAPRPSTSRGRRCSTCRARMPEPQSPGVRGARGARRSRGCSRSAAGRAFVLFTSYANMNAVAERARGRGALPAADAGRGAQAGAARDVPRARRARCCSPPPSFWQGVDVVGEQLSCVIIDKLPFASPADPVVAARIDRLRNRGGNPFAEYQVPGGDPDAEAGAGPAHPLGRATAASWPCSTAAWSSAATAGASWTACRRRGWCTTWPRSQALLRRQGGLARPRPSPRR